MGLGQRVHGAVLGIQRCNYREDHRKPDFSSTLTMKIAPRTQGEQSVRPLTRRRACKRSLGGLTVRPTFSEDTNETTITRLFALAGLCSCRRKDGARICQIDRSPLRRDGFEARNAGAAVGLGR